MTTNKFDCIVIPGGGLLGDGSLPEWTRARLEKALAIHQHAELIITLSGGTVHKPPPIDGEGYPVFESRKAAEFLIESGIHPRRILTETSSYDTIGNAYFARVLFSDPMTLIRCHIITSDFHLPRTETIFRWVYSLAPARMEYKLSFEGSSDTGLSPSVLKARQTREKKSLENLGQKIQDIRSLAAFQCWLYTEHAAYAVSGLKEHLTEDELDSY